MTTLPSFFVNNISVVGSSTRIVRGNTVSDVTANNVTAIRVRNCINARVKNNKALRINSKISSSIGFYFDNIDDLLTVYNVASRCDTGFSIGTAVTVYCYNTTAHNCTTCVETSSSGYFYNTAFSTYEGWRNYKNNTGFLVGVGASIYYDYLIHYNLGTLSSGTVTEGNNIYNRQILYIDEPNDDLTPDHISELVNSGTSNPLRTEDPCIGGIESEITDETTADRKYQYQLLDNSFWDIDNNASPEMSFIKAYQSRVLANCEVAERTVEKNMYAKEASSVERFSELFPMYMRYANATKFKKRVMDMWFATQNVSTLKSYNNSIGGYNFYPSFFKRIEDVEDAWVINESYIDDDNWLMGMEGLKYGIAIDVLGVSTMSREVSAECYTNTMNAIADLGPVKWALHEEVQPTSYYVFADMYNNFENCTLTNMIYNDDFNIQPDVAGTDARCVTPLIPTETITASGAPSGVIEVSLLDRTWSEDLTRTLYYRTGNSEASMGSWTEVDYYISGYITAPYNYLQFRIDIEDIIRRNDYEFMGIALRPYIRDRDWENEEPSPTPTPTPSQQSGPVWIGGSLYSLSDTTLTKQIEDTNFSIKGIFGYDSNSTFCCGKNTATNTAVMRKLSGGVWTTDTLPVLPSANDIRAIHGYSGSLIYAIGNTGDVISYNGTNWNNVATIGGGNMEAHSVFKFSGINALAGGQHDGSDEAYLFYRKVGFPIPIITWEQITVPDPNDIGILGIWGTSASNAWLVAGDPLFEDLTYGKVYKWNGTSLTRDTSGDLSASMPTLRSVWGSSTNDIWVVGDYGSIYHYSIASGWIQLDCPVTNLHLKGVFGYGKRELWIVGNDGTDGYILKWNDNLLKWEVLTSLDNKQLNRMGGLWG